MPEFNQQLYAYVVNGDVVEGPKSLPYRWANPATGDIEALRSKTQEELAALGWQPVKQVNLFDELDEDIFEMNTQPAKMQSGRPVVVRDAQFRANARGRMKAKVDRRAGEKRLQFISTGAGQEIEYAEKLHEARRVRELLGENFTNRQFADLEEDFSFIARDIGIDHAQAKDVVADILTQAMAWKDVGSQIANWRRRAKRDIERAPDDHAAFAAMRRALNA